MQQQVPKGLATWAGIIAAVGQYAGAVAVFLEASDRALALGPLATATVTLATVIVGRMGQAKAQTEATAAVIASSPSVMPVSYAQVWGLEEGEDEHEEGCANPGLEPKGPDASV